jgi:hypothetical protein
MTASPASRVRLPPARRDEPGDEHGHRSDQEIAGEEQRNLAGAGVQVLGDGRQDGIHQADAHEREHGRERRGPDRLGLFKERGFLCLKGGLWCRQGICELAVHGGNS